MDNESDNPLDEASELRHGPEAPAALETRVVDSLRAEGLIRTRSSWPMPARIAASVLFFVLGAAAGRYIQFGSAPAQPSTASSARYLLLLAGDVTPAADGSTRAEEYGAWASSVAAQGIAISGEELSSHSKVVATKAALFPELTSAGGYFLIEAKDDAQAESLARTCPHVKYGGSIVVRRVQ